MSYIGKIFGTIRYEIRENTTPVYKEKELEGYLVEFFGSKEKVLDEVIEIFHDDKNIGNVIHIYTKNTNEEVWYGDDNHNICLEMSTN